MGERKRRWGPDAGSSRTIAAEAQQAVRSIIRDFGDDADFCLPVYFPDATAETDLPDPTLSPDMPLAVLWSRDGLRSHYSIGINGLALHNLLVARLPQTHHDFNEVFQILQDAAQIMAGKIVGSLVEQAGGDIRSLATILEMQDKDGRRAQARGYVEPLEPVVQAAINAIYQCSHQDGALLRPVFRGDITSEQQADVMSALPVVYVWSKDGLRSHYSVSVNQRAVRALLRGELAESHPQFERAILVLARSISGAANDTVKYVMERTGAGGQAIRQVFTRGPKDPPPFTA